VQSDHSPEEDVDRELIEEADRLLKEHGYDKEAAVSDGSRDFLALKHRRVVGTYEPGSRFAEFVEGGAIEDQVVASDAEHVAPRADPSAWDPMFHGLWIDEVVCWLKGSFRSELTPHMVEYQRTRGIRAAIAAVEAARLEHSQRSRERAAARAVDDRIAVVAEHLAGWLLLWATAYVRTHPCYQVQAAFKDFGRPYMRSLVRAFRFALGRPADMGMVFVPGRIGQQVAFAVVPRTIVAYWTQYLTRYSRAFGATAIRNVVASSPLFDLLARLVHDGERGCAFITMTADGVTSWSEADFPEAKSLVEGASLLNAKLVSLPSERVRLSLDRTTRKFFDVATLVVNYVMADALEYLELVHEPLLSARVAAAHRQWRRRTTSSGRTDELRQHDWPVTLKYWPVSMST
jgi:hypothetical protein